MKVKDFNLMDEVKQAEVLLQHGVLLTERAYKEFQIVLYQVHHFYVEVYFHKTYEMIQGFRGFESMHQLDPFLEKISLKDLSIS
jgi:hypothetical protein